MVTMEHIDVLEQYCAYAKQSKAIERAMALLKEDVESIVREAGGELAFDDVKLSFGQRKKWQYPQPVVELEAELKQLKKQAETDGEAQSEVTEYLITKCG